MSARLRVVRDPTLPGRRPHGLPGPLPSAETLLWQGAPAWRGVARHVLHIRSVTIYFGILVAICTSRALIEQTGAMWFSLAALLLLGGLAMGLLVAFAMMIARTTVYTLTDRRIVLRIGVALTASLNLPFRQIEQASVRLRADGSGDIALVMSGQTRIGWLQLWPHVRPWRTQRVQPMMRCLPGAARVADMLSIQLARSLETTGNQEAKIAAANQDAPLMATGA